MEIKREKQKAVFSTTDYRIFNWRKEYSEKRLLCTNQVKII